jgi:phospholipase C
MTRTPTARHNRYILAIAASIAVTAAAVGSAGAATVPTHHSAVTPPRGTPSHSHVPKRGRYSSTTQHVIVMVQENRTVDNLFQGFCASPSQCADTQSWGLDSRGNHIPLQPTSLSAQFDPNHSHGAFVTEYDNAKMDGFSQLPLYCFKGSPNCNPTVYAYVPQTETVGYFQLAQQFALADHVLQPNQGPSFPAHQYLIAGTSGYPLAFSENPTFAAGTCAPGSGSVARIDMTSKWPGIEGNPALACGQYWTIFDWLDKAVPSLSWKYYAPDRNDIWVAPLAVKHLYNTPADNQRVVTPETTVLTDIANHALPQVSYVIPRDVFSDHPEVAEKGNGPDWVGTVANAIGTDPYYWSNTTLIVVWDDWGGWYDHYLPVPAWPGDPYEYGFRVPMIVVSPYVKPHQVDHTLRSAVSILTFIERTFGLPTLGTLDTRTDDLSVMFDYTQQPNAYVPVITHGFTPSMLRRLPRDRNPVDT